MFSLIVGLFFFRVLALYWWFFDIGSSGLNGFVLLYGVLPMVIVLGALVPLIYTYRLHRTIRRASVVFLRPILLSLGLFSLLFILEVLRTHNYPGEARGSVFDFVVRALFLG